MLRDFNPEADRRLLRDIVRRLGAARALTLGQLLRDLRRHAKLNPKYTPIGRGTLYRFVNKNDEVRNSNEQLEHMWTYLVSRPSYQEFLMDEFGFQPSGRSSVSGAEDSQDSATDLFRALETFFDPDGRASNKTKIDSISEKIIGPYIMYRPDIRPVIEPLRPNGLVRASRFDVFESNGGLYCKETQSTPRDEYGADNFQINMGPFFAYEDKVFFIMCGEGNHSLKFGAIEMMRDWNKPPMPWFRGSLLVVSNFGTFPLVKFFCLRNDQNYSDGILALSAMPDKDVSTFIGRCIDELRQNKD